MHIFFQIRSKFAVDDRSHYLFTPRDLTNWVLALFRYIVDSSLIGTTAEHLLEICAYEARRLFRDRMVGEHVEKCDNIIKSVIRSDWSVHLDNLDTLYYVTWGGSAKAVVAEQTEATASITSTSLHAFGRPLGRLDPTDLRQVLAKGMITYGELKWYYISTYSHRLHCKIGMCRISEEGRINILACIHCTVSRD